LIARSHLGIDELPDPPELLLAADDLATGERRACDRCAFALHASDPDYGDHSCGLRGALAL